MPDPTDLARRMLASAKEASKGPWRVGTMTKDGVRVDTPETWFEMDRDRDAHYIALCSPANIEVLAEAYLGMAADTNLAIYIAEDLQSRIDRALELLPGCKMDTEKGEWGDNEEAVSAVCAALTGADET